MRKSYLVYSRIKFGSGNGLVPAKFWERAKQFIVIRQLAHTVARH